MAAGSPRRERTDPGAGPRAGQEAGTPRLSEPGSPSGPVADHRPPDLLWPFGAATGVGSLPGDLTSADVSSTAEITDALRVVFDAVPDLPFLPELPHRGPGADMIGRGAMLLTDLYVDLQPAGWRLVSRPGRDHRRALDLLQRDLDALQVVASDYTGVLKLQAAGPWTLAASLELERGNRALVDPGAVRDLAESLADGLAAHIADVRRRVPGAQLILALDEPLLPAVLLGRLRSASGFGVLPTPEAGVMVQRLATVTGATGAPTGVHCCAANPPVALMHKAGAAFLSVDLTLDFDEDQIAEAVEAGVGLIAGLVDPLGTGPELSDAGRTVEPVFTLWKRVGLVLEQLREVAVSPTCGLAGSSPAGARRALQACREAGKRIAEGEQ